MSHRYPSPFRAWYLVILLTTAYAFSFVDKYLPALLIEPIKVALGASDTQMGFLLGPAFAVLYATLGLPLGWLGRPGSGATPWWPPAWPSGHWPPPARDWRRTSRTCCSPGWASA